MARCATAQDERAGAGRATPPFHAITPFTMLDYPGRIACILWVAGCNMRCLYCHNPQIVAGKGTIGEEQALAFLRKRKGLLEGVVFSGGEATTWTGLAAFMARVKVLGYAIKLDTNGLRPDVIARLLEGDLLDRVALDYKAPLHKFRTVTGASVFARFARSLDLLCGQHRIPVEVRSTIHADLLGEEDILEMAHDLSRRGYRGTYALQRAVAGPDRPTLGDLPADTRPFDAVRLARLSPLELAVR
ncbi:anaerobic ribonucleoside-triphosphate reductase activating protein [Qipengyuania mesophila]|uniref:anaerobic ribonucleoside-triphosphate reductase activating protein n=1 Tax=Qipengyuania mesophila TaxID=2867246 RepID=UPI0035118CCE